MRIIGLDIHRAFAEAVAWEEGKLRRLGRVDMRRDLLTAFAEQLSPDDVVIVEATGNASAVAAVLAPRVKKVVIANPMQMRVIPCEDQDRHDRRRRPGSALCERVPAGGVGSGRAYPGSAPASHPSKPDRLTAIPVEEHHSVDSAQPPDPVLSSRRPLRSEGPGLARRAGRAGGRAARH